MSPLIKNALIATIAAVALWFGYQMFIANDDPLLVSSNTTATSQAARDAQQFLVRLQQLNAIEFDRSVFEDVRFRSLVDLRQVVLDEPVGRTNPFAPIGQ